MTAKRRQRNPQKRKRTNEYNIPEVTDEWQKDKPSVYAWEKDRMCLNLRKKDNAYTKQDDKDYQIWTPTTLMENIAFWLFLIMLMAIMGFAIYYS